MDNDLSSTYVTIEYGYLLFITPLTVRGLVGAIVRPLCGINSDTRYRQTPKQKANFEYCS